MLQQAMAVFMLFSLGLAALFHSQGAALAIIFAVSFLTLAGFILAGLVLMYAVVVHLRNNHHQSVHLTTADMERINSGYCLELEEERFGDSNT